MKARRTIDHAGPRSSRAALTLLEMMVAVTLLAAIMVGLAAMFNQTQKALHIANAQTDVFENARGAIRMIARDLSEMAPLSVPNAFNAIGLDGAAVGANLPVTTTSPPTNVPVQFSEAFWLTRANDEWQGIGYYVTEDESSGKTNTGVGSLFRFTATARREEATNLFGRFVNPGVTNVHRISDGIVHFAFLPVYPVASNSFVRSSTGFSFPRTVSGNVRVDLPAYVDVEIGVLEPTALKQYYAIRDLDAAKARNFLRDHVGKIHFFRERVPIRNFVNPFRANEVP